MIKWSLTASITLRYQEPSNVYIIQEKFRVHVYPGKNQKLE